MRAASITSWDSARICRLVVSTLLALMLVLSGISVDVFVTHTHDDSPVHTHVSRTLSTRDVHQHHDSQHDHHHRSIPGPDDGKDQGPGGPESESTIVVSSAGNLIRQARDTAKSVLDLLPAALLVQSTSVEIYSSPGHVLITSSSERPSSIDVMRCIVLLI